MHVDLGNRKLQQAHKGLNFEFFGKKTVDIAEYLQGVADIRHRLTHSSGRVDIELITKYPGIGLKEGSVIQMPQEMPFDFYFSVVKFTQVIDDEFAKVFSWY